MAIEMPFDDSSFSIRIGQDEKDVPFCYLLWKTFDPSVITAPNAHV